jgi:hypothetical protein
LPQIRGVFAPTSSPENSVIKATDGSFVGVKTKRLIVSRHFIALLSPASAQLSGNYVTAARPLWGIQGKDLNSQTLSVA